LRVQESAYQSEIRDISIELAAVIHDIESYEELKRATKSYLSCSFDEALETISENATRLVRCIPNMANATIQLMGVWETKEGKVKEEVNAVLNLDGDENIDIRSLCGGERSAIDLAVDLSAIELIENKANKGINIFVLDEPFNGLDTVCIEMALEVLMPVHTKNLLLLTTTRR
jgi:DNA repair exonuclease SbcCD ATPase subunit